jgi:hypothetical protein
MKNAVVKNREKRATLRVRVMRGKQYHNVSSVLQADDKPVA